MVAYGALVSNRLGFLSRNIARCLQGCTSSRLNSSSVSRRRPSTDVNQATTGNALTCKNNGRLQTIQPSLLAAWPARYFHSSSYAMAEARVINCPAFAESVTEGDIRWEKAVGDVVKEDEAIGEVETDKTGIPIYAPVAGVIVEFLAATKTTVRPGMPLVKIQPGAAAAAQPKAADKAPQQASAQPTKPAADVRPSVAPAHDDSAARKGPAPSKPPPVPSVPSSPLLSTPIADVKVTTARLGAEPIIGSSRGEERVKMNRMRLRIAQRLKDAQNTCAMLTTFNEVDMSNITEMRTLYKDAYLKKHGVKLGFMSAFVRAAAYALKDQPVVNAVIDNNEIVYRDYVDISVAVSTPKGLVVPVVRNVETMNYAQIEKSIEELGIKARDGALAVEDMDGGTFTISNGGVFGSLFGTPIINPPQSAILGMHGIFERPVAVKGKVEVRPMMYVALTYDHRLIDGREAVTFLRKIKSAVEDPRVMLLDI